MKWASVAIVLGLLMHPGVSDASPSGQCGGTAPLDSHCTFKIVLSSTHVFLSASFFPAYVGFIHTTATGPTGKVEESCFVEGIGAGCTGTTTGSFAKGQTVIVDATATGVGFWQVSATSQ